MSTDGQSASPDPCGRTLTDFLLRARRRRLAAGLLAAAIPAALLNEAFRWGGLGAVRWLRRDVPVLDVGPFVLLALVPVLWRRWSPAAVARDVDHRLRFRDRLTSFLDFRVRSDVPAEIRGAQAGEAARSLAGIAVQAASPVRLWLAAGPALLAASLLYPLFAPNVPRTLTYRIAGRLMHGSPARLAGPDSAAEREAPGDPGSVPGTIVSGERTRGEQATAPPGQKVPGDGKKVPETGETPVDKKKAALSGPVSGGAEPGSPPRRPPSPESGQDQRNAQEPSRITSERVGTDLARVVDPLLTAGSRPAPPAPPLRGTFSFRLLPRTARGEGSGGDRPGEADRPDRVTVDLDTLPEPYRQVVRTYFELLAGERAGGGLPTTPSGKETTR